MQTRTDVSFGLVATLAKYNTRFMSSMDAIFWRSVFAIALNYVRFQSDTRQ